MKSFGGKVLVFRMMWLRNDPAAAVKFHYPLSRDTLSKAELRSRVHNVGGGAPFHISGWLKCFKESHLFITHRFGQLLCCIKLARPNRHLMSTLIKIRRKPKCLFFSSTADIYWCVRDDPPPDNLINNSRTGSPRRYHPTFQQAALQPPPEPDRWHMVFRHSVCSADGDARVPV